jgi:hypothetical protein
MVNGIQNLWIGDMGDHGQHSSASSSRFWALNTILRRSTTMRTRSFGLQLLSRTGSARPSSEKNRAYLISLKHEKAKIAKYRKWGASIKVEIP